MADSAFTAGIKRRLGELNPRDRRALGALAAAALLFGLGTAVYLVHASLAARAERNRRNAEVLSLVREKGPAYRERVAEQRALDDRLAADLPSLPTVLGEVLAQLGQQRQDFQEIPPEAVGLPGQKKKPWIRASVKFPLRRVSAQTVYEFLIQLRERYPDYPLAVTALDMRLDRTQDALYNVDMVVSGYRLAERPAAEDGEDEESPATDAGARDRDAGSTPGRDREAAGKSEAKPPAGGPPPVVVPAEGEPAPRTGVAEPPRPVPVEAVPVQGGKP